MKGHCDFPTDLHIWYIVIEQMGGRGLDVDATVCVHVQDKFRPCLFPLGKSLVVLHQMFAQMHGVLNVD